MLTRNIGRSGLISSVVGLGCNNFGMRLDESRSTEVVQAALDAGYTMFDTADSYGDGFSETVLGAALKSVRDDVVIATKFASRMGAGPYRGGASRRYVQACEASLRRLDTDYIDLYYQHYPDPLTPIEETLSALSDLIHQGKVRYAASSNVAAWQVVDADHIAARAGLSRFVATQHEWSLLSRSAETELAPACTSFGVGIIPYFPLASGLLTGKYRRGEPYPAGSRLAELPFFARMANDERFDKIDALGDFAAQRGHSLVELAMSWLVSQPGVSVVLAGATTPEQASANAASVAWSLSHDDLGAVAAILD